MQWRGDIARGLPRFGETYRLEGVARKIRADVDACARAHLPAVASQVQAPRFQTRDDIGDLLLAALYASRYGTIYWLTPDIALRSMAAGSRAMRALDSLGRWLGESGWANRWWNATVATFLESQSHQLMPVGGFAPHWGFQAVSARQLAVRPEEVLPGDDALASNVPRHDLHDFAHLAACRMSGELYGNKFHLPSRLGALPSQLVDLVAGFDSDQTPQHADGVLFGRVLQHLFERGVTDPDLPEWVIVQELADALLPYLLGEGSAFDPVLQCEITATRSVNVYELAVLAQNKAYELPASEAEQVLFVRGGRDERDQLAGLSASDRLRVVAGLARRTYHERRNTLKHRAHAEAYVRAASLLLRDTDLAAPERELANAVVRSLRFLDFWDGDRRNLIDDAATLLQASNTGMLDAYAPVSAAAGSPS